MGEDCLYKRSKSHVFNIHYVLYEMLDEHCSMIYEVF